MERGLFPGLLAIPSCLSGGVEKFACPFPMTGAETLADGMEERRDISLKLLLLWLQGRFN